MGMAMLNLAADGMPMTVGVNQAGSLEQGQISQDMRRLSRGNHLPCLHQETGIGDIFDKSEVVRSRYYCFCSIAPSD